MEARGEKGQLLALLQRRVPASLPLLRVHRRSMAVFVKLCDALDLIICKKEQDLFKALYLCCRVVEEAKSRHTLVDFVQEETQEMDSIIADGLEQYSRSPVSISAALSKSLPQLASLCKDAKFVTAAIREMLERAALFHMVPWLKSGEDLIYVDVVSVHSDRKARQRFRIPDAQQPSLSAVEPKTPTKSVFKEPTRQGGIHGSPFVPSFSGTVGVLTGPQLGSQTAPVQASDGASQLYSPVSSTQSTSLAEEDEPSRKRRALGQSAQVGDDVLGKAVLLDDDLDLSLDLKSDDDGDGGHERTLVTAGDGFDGREVPEEAGLREVEDKMLASMASATPVVILDDREVREALRQDQTVTARPPQAPTPTSEAEAPSAASELKPSACSGDHVDVAPAQFERTNLQVERRMKYQYLASQKMELAAAKEKLASAEKDEAAIQKCLVSLRGKLLQQHATPKPADLLAKIRSAHGNLEQYKQSVVECELGLRRCTAEGRTAKDTLDAIQQMLKDPSNGQDESELLREQEAAAQQDCNSTSVACERAKQEKEVQEKLVVESLAAVEILEQMRAKATEDSGGSANCGIEITAKEKEQKMAALKVRLALKKVQVVQSEVDFAETELERLDNVIAAIPSPLDVKPEIDLTATEKAKEYLTAASSRPQQPLNPQLKPTNKKEPIAATSSPAGKKSKKTKTAATPQSASTPSATKVGGKAESSAKKCENAADDGESEEVLEPADKKRSVSGVGAKLGIHREDAAAATGSREETPLFVDWESFSCTDPFPIGFPFATDHDESAAALATKRATRDKDGRLCKDLMAGVNCRVMPALHIRISTVLAYDFVNRVEIGENKLHTGSAGENKTRYSRLVKIYIVKRYLEFLQLEYNAVNPLFLEDFKPIRAFLERERKMLDAQFPRLADTTIAKMLLAFDAIIFYQSDEKSRIEYKDLSAYAAENGSEALYGLIPEDRLAVLSPNAQLLIKRVMVGESATKQSIDSLLKKVYKGLHPLKPSEPIVVPRLRHVINRYEAGDAVGAAPAPILPYGSAALAAAGRTGVAKKADTRRPKQSMPADPEQLAACSGPVAEVVAELGSAHRSSPAVKKKSSSSAAAAAAASASASPAVPRKRVVLSDSDDEPMAGGDGEGERLHSERRYVRVIIDEEEPWVLKADGAEEPEDSVGRIAADEPVCKAYLYSDKCVRPPAGLDTDELIADRFFREHGYPEGIAVGTSKREVMQRVQLQVSAMTRGRIKRVTPLFVRPDSTALDEAEDRSHCMEDRLLATHNVHGLYNDNTAVALILERRGHSCEVTYVAVMLVVRGILDSEKTKGLLQFVANDLYFSLCNVIPIWTLRDDGDVCDCVGERAEPNEPSGRGLVKLFGCTSRRDPIAGTYTCMRKEGGPVDQFIEGTDAESRYAVIQKLSQLASEASSILEHGAPTAHKSQTLYSGRARKCRVSTVPENSPFSTVQILIDASMHECRSDSETPIGCTVRFCLVDKCQDTSADDSARPLSAQSFVLPNLRAVVDGKESENVGIKIPMYDGSVIIGGFSFLDTALTGIDDRVIGGPASVLLDFFLERGLTLENHGITSGRKVQS